MEKVTTLEGQRVPTGALQIDGDWPGLFVRGDEVGGYAAVIERTLQEIVAIAGALPAGTDTNRIDKLMQDAWQLGELQRLLQSVIVTAR